MSLKDKIIELKRKEEEEKAKEGNNQEETKDTELNKESNHKGVASLGLQNLLKSSSQPKIAIVLMSAIFVKEQTRKHFDITAIAELVQNIKTNGLLQPIVLKDNKDGTYTIVAGERRYRACQELKHTEIQAHILHENADYELVQIAENLNRENLLPIEESIMFSSLMQKRGLNQSELSLLVNKNRMYVLRRLALLKTSEGVQKELKNGKSLKGAFLSAGEDSRTITELLDEQSTDSSKSHKKEKPISNSEAKDKEINKSISKKDEFKYLLAFFLSNASQEEKEKFIDGEYHLTEEHKKIITESYK